MALIAFFVRLSASEINFARLSPETAILSPFLRGILPSNLSSYKVDKLSDERVNRYFGKEKREGGEKNPLTVAVCGGFGRRGRPDFASHNPGTPRRPSPPRVPAGRDPPPPGEGENRCGPASFPGRNPPLLGRCQGMVERLARISPPLNPRYAQRSA
jgi:hypothetical protein